MITMNTTETKTNSATSQTAYTRTTKTADIADDQFYRVTGTSCLGSLTMSFERDTKNAALHTAALLERAGIIKITIQGWHWE